MKVHNIVGGGDNNIKASSREDGMEKKAKPQQWVLCTEEEKRKRHRHDARLSGKMRAALHTQHASIEEQLWPCFFVFYF